MNWVARCPEPTLCVCRSGLKWTLEPRSCITADIVRSGVFEPKTTERVVEFLKPGMTVIDVGANVGYFAVLMARSVTATGRIIAFEPTQRYRRLCEINIAQNGYADTIELRSEALSDSAMRASISIDSASATLHWSAPGAHPREHELVQTQTLDGLSDQLRLSKLDFIKVDIDGHEPAFVRGAAKTIRQFRPVIVIEFAQHCLYSAGSSALDLKRQLSELDYTLLNEKTMQPFASELAFLMECGNYAFSANAFAIPSEIVN